ncbi:RING finger domain protein [Talaromyces islandicus]|uniref:RING finger domain protein n=1 Tax=Talaromyces islandicus TaxID=28573 RepID=A0A0U1MA83_TALIS|nr:RING finger domain protein [Talaromyces islandicus]
MGSLRYAGLFATLVERDKNQNDDNNNNDNKNNSSPGSQSVTALLGAVLGIALLLAVYFNRRSRKEAEDPNGKNSLERLKRLEAVSPTRTLREWWPTVKESLGLSQSVDSHFVCVICFEQVELSHGIHELKCMHVFHKQCLEKWYLRSHYTCPMCHQQFFHERSRPAHDYIWMV